MADAATLEPDVVESDRAVALVDCDIHPLMTPEMIAERLSPKWRRYYEQFGFRMPTLQHLYPRARGGGLRLDAWPDKPGLIPGSDPELMRRQHLDEYGIDFCVLIPFPVVDCYELPEFAADLCRASNDWIWEEWIESDARILSGFAVPHEYPDLALREFELRAQDPRWCQLNMPSHPQEPLGSRKYWPLYQAAADRGIPVGFHASGYVNHRGAGSPGYYLEEHVLLSAAVANQVQSLVLEGVFEAIPNLKVVMVEAGVAWATSLAWSLDAAWSQLRDSAPYLRRRPSEYMHDHVWFTSQPVEEPDDPEHFLQVLEHGNLLDRVMFATDYPHWDFDSPKMALPRVFSLEQRANIMAGNACRLYGLPGRVEAMQ